MKSVVGQQIVKSEYAEYLYDESRYTLGIPEAIYFPESSTDIINLFLQLSKENTSISLIGSQTGITGGAVPSEGSIAISFKHFNKILRIETQENSDRILYCQPGVTLAQINDFLRQPEKYKNDVKGYELVLSPPWFYPPDPTEMTAQLGGTVATNASGARSFKFGSTRNHIVYLSLVLINGDTISIYRGQNLSNNGQGTILTNQGEKLIIPTNSYSSPLIKNASGYFCQPDMDCIDLFIGSEGTLAAFTEIGIRLSPCPQFLGGLSFFKNHTYAFQWAQFLRKQKQTAAIEYFDSTALDFLQQEKGNASLKLQEFPPQSKTAVYWEWIETPEDSFENHIDRFEKELNNCLSSFEHTWSGFDDQEMDRLKKFRHAIPELINHKIAQIQKTYPQITKISTDAAVKEPSFSTFFSHSNALITKNNLQSVIFGHLGDFHLHFNIIPQSQDDIEKAWNVYNKIMELVIAEQGTISAEHGIGKLKRKYLSDMYGNSAIKKMKGIKKIFDPKGRLNQGNLFFSK